jgi:serine O-acetyltransferase
MAAGALQYFPKGFVLFSILVFMRFDRRSADPHWIREKKALPFDSEGSAFARRTLGAYNGRAWFPGFRRLLAFDCRIRNSAEVNTAVTELADQLIASYARFGGINHIDGVNLPSKTAIGGITIDLLKLLFPGFFDEKSLHSSEIKLETANLMDSVLGRLEDEIYKSLKANPEFARDRRDPRTSARNLTTDFLRKFPRLREILQTDIEAAFHGDPAALNKEEIIVAYPFVEAIAVQRMSHELYLNEVPLIPRIMTEWAHSRSGMDLHPGAQIGQYFFVDHCTGTVIGETAIIGDHVKMYQGVGLVARSLAGGQTLRGQKRHPTIEDHVTIYAGATIVGGETVIGEGSTIGANVFLMHSVPPNSLVLQEDVKVKVLKKDRDRGKADFQI